MTSIEPLEPSIATLPGPGHPAFYRQFVLAGALLVAAASLCIAQGLTNRRLQEQIIDRQARAIQLATDATEIAKLMQRPRIVAESGLPDADLLERVTRAMKSVSLSPDTLVSTLPQPIRRIAGASQMELSHRLLFEKVQLEPMVRLCCALQQDYPELHVTGFQFNATADGNAWNVEITITCFVYSDHQGERPREST